MEHSSSKVVQGQGRGLGPEGGQGRGWSSGAGCRA